MKVSVVIPCYNGARYLPEALRSIRNQTVKPYEVILINDGSTDNSTDVFNAFKLRCKQVCVTLKENRGIGAAREWGYHMVTGDYLAFLSTDDMWLPAFLEKSIPHLNFEQATFTDYYRWIEETGKLQRFYAKEGSREKIIEYALAKDMFINFSSIVMPKIPVHFEKRLSYGEDLIFLLDTVIHGLQWKRIPQPLMKYRIHPGQGTRKVDFQKWQLLWAYLVNRLKKLEVETGWIDANYCISYLKCYPGTTERLIHRIPEAMRNPGLVFQWMASRLKRAKGFITGS